MLSRALTQSGLVLPTAAVLLLSALCAPIYARPAGSVSCAVDGLTAAQRTTLGASLVNGPPGDQKSFAAAGKAIATPTSACTKANHWTASQAEAVGAWSVWKLMADELQRQSQLAAPDAAILKAYVDEDPKRLANLAGFAPAKLAQVIDDLRKRGAHVHASGDDRDRELGYLLFLTEMNAKEREFLAP